LEKLNQLIMETITIDKDIHVFYKTAKSFPDGVLAAHQTLHALVPFTTDRRYFGISRPEQGGDIVYKAAAEELTEGEGKSLNCDTMTLKKGSYISLVLHDYMKDIPSIGQAFTQLISEPGIDPEGYCVEWYISQTDMRCMVRLAG
jgi:hypothetical protein